MEIFGYNIQSKSAKLKQELSQVKNELEQVKESSSKKGKRITDTILATRIERIKQDIAGWRYALEIAEDSDNPDRMDLYQLYKEIEDDSRVTSAKGTRIDAVTLADFSIYINGEADEELQEFFEGKWFNDFLKGAMEHVFYGFSLIQLTDMYSTVKKVEVIAPLNTAPEYSAIKKDSYGGIHSGNLITYTNTEYEPYLIEVFQHRKDLGLYNKIAPYYLWKKVLGAWAEYADRFGFPFRSVKTDISDPDRLKQAESMLRDMAGSTYGVFDLQDEFMMETASSSGGYQVFEALIKECKNSIAEIILRQTSSIDEKAFAGSADVHNEIRHEVVKADKKYIAYLVNDSLIPKLVALGVVPESTKFYWDSADNLSTMDKVDTIVKLSAFYKIPAEFVEKWVGVEIEETQQATAAVESTMENMYENNFRHEHSASVKDLNEFIPGTFYRKTVTSGVNIIGGKLEFDKSSAIQTYRFDAEKFTEKQAMEWLKKHGVKILTFEPALKNGKND